ncbi:MAG: hypothetical protein ACFCUN_03125 [Hyphomicrobiaceae bacterium]
MALKLSDTLLETFQPAFERLGVEQAPRFVLGERQKILLDGDDPALKPVEAAIDAIDSATDVLEMFEHCSLLIRRHRGPLHGTSYNSADRLAQTVVSSKNKNGTNVKGRERTLVRKADVSKTWNVDRCNEILI